MDENNLNALFVEPNAYINFNYSNAERNKERRKIVFQEPYEYMPNYHMDNDFKPIEKPKPPKQQASSPLNFLSNLDIKSLLPLAQLFFKKESGVDVSKIMSALPKGDNNLISTLISNPEIMKLATNFLTNKQKLKPKTEMKSTEFEIKDYVKVE